MTIFHRAVALVPGLSAAIIGCGAAFAQAVLVESAGGQSGQGYMVASGGNCYLLLPAHVAGPFPQVTVQTESPVLIGQAAVNRPFWTVTGGPDAPVQGLDLAIGVVRGEAVRACRQDLAKFAPPDRLTALAEGDLITILPGGKPDPVRMAITSISYLTLDAEVRSPDKQIFPGRSGSFLFVGGAPVGMAITSDDPGRVRLVRMQEILMNANRWIGSQGAAFGSDTEAAPVVQGSGLAVRLVETNAVPADAASQPEATLTGIGGFRFRPTGPVRFVYRIEGGASGALSRVRITADPAAGHALPKSVLIEVDSTETRTRPRVFRAGIMAQDGIFDTGPLGSVSARWITVTISSAWSDGPVGLSSVRFD